MIKRVMGVVRRVKLRVHVPKAVRNALISSGVLLVLMVGGGVAYTFFVGQSSDTDMQAVSVPAATTSEPVIKPTKPSPNAKVGASVQMVTSPVKPGSNASIDVKTLPGATCKIAVIYNDVPSTDSGLITKLADDYGLVSWSWTVGKSVPEGTWPVKVTCSYHSHSGVVQADLKVTN